LNAPRCASRLIASVTDGTLAIFADHDLLLTTGCATMRQPIRRPSKNSCRWTAPTGVALYRADKSLQTEKEGLGELRADSEIP